MSRSSSPILLRFESGTALPLINARERPSALTTRRSRQSPSRSSALSPSQVCTNGRAEMSNSAANSARFAPPRTSVALPRSPRTSPIASTRIDLPAPVSPVSTVMPESNSTSSFSTIAKSRTCRFISIGYSTFPVSAVASPKQLGAQNTVEIIAGRMYQCNPLVCSRYSQFVVWRNTAH